jgi:hypothetical protein
LAPLVGPDALGTQPGGLGLDQLLDGVERRPALIRLGVGDGGQPGRCQSNVSRLDPDPEPPRLLDLEASPGVAETSAGSAASVTPRAAPNTRPPALTSSSLAPECCPRAQAERIDANHHLLGYPAAGTYWRDGNRQWVVALSLPSASGDGGHRPGRPGEMDQAAASVGVIHPLRVMLLHPGLAID